MFRFQIGRTNDVVDEKEEMEHSQNLNSTSKTDQQFTQKYISGKPIQVFTLSLGTIIHASPVIWVALIHLSY